jgi:ABC-type uncharacterized transport system involved in gliding motility auxiliary subunit
MERKQRAASLSGLFLAVIAAVIIAANWLSYGLNGRWDATKNERYTLSNGSARLVREGLKEQLKVTLYVTRGLPKTELFVEDLVDLMKEYETASGGKFEYTIVEPKTDEEREKAKEAGLQEAAFGEGSETGDSATIAKGYMGMVFEYGSEKDTIPLLHPDQTSGLEFWITNKIREIRDRADDTYQKIGVITKEGIKITDSHLVPPQGGRPGPSIKGILEQALPFYKIEEVDLQKGDAEINSELRGVIMLQADEDWTEKELARIDQFLMKGDKSLLVVAGAVNMKAADATMKGELNTRGIEKLLDPYGVEMKKEAIVDWQALMRIPFQNQMGQIDWVPAPGVLQLQHDDGAEEDEQPLDNSFLGFFRLEELAFPYPSTLVAHPEKQPEAKVTVVARSTKSSTGESETVLDFKPRTDWKPKGEYAPRAIAVSVEGKLKSAFAAKPPSGVEIPKESASESRVLVIASGQFLGNPFARAGNPPPMPPQMQMMGANFGGDPNLQQIAVLYARQYLTATILSFKNLLDWMANDKDLIAVSAKLLSDANLSYADVPKPEIKPDDSEEVVNRKLEEYRQGRKSLQQRVQWTMTLFPPLLFAGFGFLRWRMREANRDKVKLD